MPNKPILICALVTLLHCSALWAAEAGDGDALIDTYVQQGTAHQQEGRHAEAITAFESALNATRTQHGLLALQQVSLLNALVSSHTALQQWEAVDAAHQLQFHLSQRQLAPGNEQRFQAFVALSQWRQQAMAKDLLPRNTMLVSETELLYQSEISKLEAAQPFPAASLQLATLYLDLASVQILQAQRHYDTPLLNYNTGAQDPLQLQQRCQPVRMADGSLQQICTTETTMNPDYVMNTTNDKIENLRFYLDGMKNSVLAALNHLQQDQQPTSQRNELLRKAAQLTKQYNDFAAQSSPKTGTRLEQR